MFVLFVFFLRYHIMFYSSIKWKTTVFNITKRKDCYLLAIKIIQQTIICFRLQHCCFVFVLYWYFFFILLVLSKLRTELYSYKHDNWTYLNTIPCRCFSSSFQVHRNTHKGGTLILFPVRVNITKLHQDKLYLEVCQSTNKL